MIPMLHKRFPDRGGAISAQTTHHIISDQGRVLFLPWEKICWTGRILIWVSSLPLEPFIGGGSKKWKSSEQASTSSQVSVKRKSSLKKKKDVDVASIWTWEGDVLPLDVSPGAYLAPGSSHIVVLLPSSTLSGCFLFDLNFLLHTHLFFNWNFTLHCFIAPANTTTVGVAPSVEAPHEPIVDEVVEEFKTNPESPAENQHVVKEVNSPSPLSSPGFSNILYFSTDDVVDKFL